MSTQQRSVQSAQVLLVDDDRVTAILVENAFQNLPHLELMHVVWDGIEAMEFLKREGQYSNAQLPDLVLLDINMPNKDGFAVLDEMAEDPVICKVPVIMFSTSERQEDIHKAYEGGANAFMTKPIDFSDLEQAMRYFADFWVKAAQTPELSDVADPTHVAEPSEPRD
jgi:CheY-like chemotaxis protein